MSDFGVIILVGLFINSCLYEMNLGETEVLYVEFNKKYILLFFVTFGNVPHHHYVHP